MNNQQRVLVFSLAMVVCLVVSSVTADDADDTKAAALFEMLYPEYNNNPELQAVSAPSSSKISKNSDVGFQVELQRSPIAKRGQCTGTALDIFIDGCTDAEAKRGAIPGIGVAGRMRDVSNGLAKRMSLEEPIFSSRQRRCNTGIPAIDIMCQQEIEAVKRGLLQIPTFGSRQRRAACNTGIPALDIYCQKSGKRAQSLLNEKRAEPRCTGLPGFDILGCSPGGEAKRSFEFTGLEVLETLLEANEN